MSNVLVDTSFLVALNSPNDQYHVQSVKFVNETEHDLLLPEIVLTEAAFLIRREGGIPAVLSFLDRLVQVETVLHTLILDDLRRARAIMATYSKARLDFVDCCLMALAERYKITRICTYDHRDFAMVKPAHAPFLELLP